MLLMDSIQIMQHMIDDEIDEFYVISS